MEAKWLPVNEMGAEHWPTPNGGLFKTQLEEVIWEASWGRDFASQVSDLQHRTGIPLRKRQGRLWIPAFF